MGLNWHRHGEQARERGWRRIGLWSAVCDLSFCSVAHGQQSQRRPALNFAHDAERGLTESRGRASDDEQLLAAGAHAHARYYPFPSSASPSIFRRTHLVLVLACTTVTNESFELFNDRHRERRAVRRCWEGWQTSVPNRLSGLR